jgi:hypothetical protein
LLPFVTILEDSNGHPHPNDGGWRSENLLPGNAPGLAPSLFTGIGCFYRPVKIPLRSENHPMTEARQMLSMHQCGFFGKFYVDVFFCSESAMAC